MINKCVYAIDSDNDDDNEGCEDQQLLIFNIFLPISSSVVTWVWLLHHRNRSRPEKVLKRSSSINLFLNNNFSQRSFVFFFFSLWFQLRPTVVHSIRAQHMNAHDWHIQTHWLNRTVHPSSSTSWMHFTRRYAQTCVVVVATDHASTQLTYSWTLFTFSFEFYLSHSFCMAQRHWSSQKLHEGLTFFDLFELRNFSERNRHVESGLKSCLSTAEIVVAHRFPENVRAECGGSIVDQSCTIRNSPLQWCPKNQPFRKFLICVNSFAPPSHSVRSARNSWKNSLWFVVFIDNNNNNHHWKSQNGSNFVVLHTIAAP